MFSVVDTQVFCVVVVTKAEDLCLGTDYLCLSPVLVSPSNILALGYEMHWPARSDL